jgi:hypothetical protein
MEYQVTLTERADRRSVLGILTSCLFTYANIRERIFQPTADVCQILRCSSAARSEI